MVLGAGTQNIKNTKKIIVENNDNEELDLFERIIKICAWAAIGIGGVFKIVVYAPTAIRKTIRGMKKITKERIVKIWKWCIKNIGIKEMLVIAGFMWSGIRGEYNKFDADQKHDESTKQINCLKTEHKKLVVKSEANTKEIGRLKVK